MGDKSQKFNDGNYHVIRGSWSSPQFFNLVQFRTTIFLSFPECFRLIQIKKNQGGKLKKIKVCWKGSREMGRTQRCRLTITRTLSPRQTVRLINQKTHLLSFSDFSFAMKKQSCPGIYHIKGLSINLTSLYAPFGHRKSCDNLYFCLMGLKYTQFLNLSKKWILLGLKGTRT